MPTSIALLLRLGRDLSLGHWVELTRHITTLQKRQVFPAFMPEMMSFYFKPGEGTSQTRDGKSLRQHACVPWPNEWAHRRETWDEEAFTRKFREQKGPLLDRLLTALGF